jgi:hypothetical protein
VAGSTVKKVIVRRFDREALNGFINPLSYLQPLHLELLRPEGSLVLLPYEEVKSVSFVKDFEAGEEPNRIFLNRPKLDGVWVRMEFRDGDRLDGILPNDLLAWEIAGFTVTPPEPDSNNQRVFVPRQALRKIQVLGIVGSPLRAKRRAKEASPDQGALF